MRASYKAMTPFMTAAEADQMLRIAEARGVFRTYAEEALNEGIGESLPQRFDAAFNYIQHGIDGHGNTDEVSTAAQRTNYFRETYAYGNEIQAPGVEPFFTHPDLLNVAREVTGRPLVVPAIVYANILTPGQELAIHTDVPEGPQGPRESMPAVHNTAILIDTDTVFHGVERVTSKAIFPEIDKGATLTFKGGDQWSLANLNGLEAARYSWSDLRYSISWKAYCFKDEAEKAMWSDKSDDLTLDRILDVLEAALRSRGVLTMQRPDPTSFAQMLVNEFIRFPMAKAG